MAAGATIIGDGVLAKADKANVIFCQLAPWQFEGDQLNLKQTRRRTSFLVSRLLANSGIAGSAPIVERFQSPVAPAPRSIAGQTVCTSIKPEEWDDPYRFFRW